MATILKHIEIASTPADVFKVLSTLKELEDYDPTVNTVTLMNGRDSGVGSKRRVLMKDNKNWFEEECVDCRANEGLAFELRACSFPIHSLRHEYTIEETTNGTRVSERMQYKVKFGLLGKLMDALMIRSQSTKGIQLFLDGLKKHVEHKAIKSAF